MKRLSSIVLVLLLIVAALPICSSAGAAPYVKLGRTAVTLGVGETYTLKISASTKSYTCSSSNRSVATVSKEGKITAKAVGKATVTVKVSGVSAKCVVTVKEAPNDIKLNKTSITLGVGEKFTFKSTVNSGAASYTRKYTTSNPKSVSRSGSTVTAVKPGTSVIRVRTYNGLIGTCKVTVKSAPTSVKLNRTSVTLGVGESCSLTSAVNKGAASYKRSYTSSNSAVAARKGSLLIAKKPGTAVITVKTYNGKTATCKVTVKPAPTKITLNREFAVLNIGNTVQLTSSVNSGSFSSRKIYKSDNTAVASVSEDGTVTAKSGGRAKITVTSYNGFTASCDIYVISSYKYVKGTWLHVYKQPKSENGLRLPYMTELGYICNYSTSKNGRWDIYEYGGGIFYMWTEAGAESKVTDKRSTFTYSVKTQYEKDVVNGALNILNNKKTRYIWGTTGQPVSGTANTYSYDCSGFASSVIDAAMKKYVPVYNISANLQNLYYQEDAIYNGGTKAAFYATDVIAKGEKLDISKLRAGDLLFFWLYDESNEENYQKETTHVGLYLGNGEFIHCSQGFDRVIIMPLIGIYADGFVKASRMLPETVQDVNETMYTKGNLVALRSSMYGQDDSNLIERLPIETPVLIRFISSTKNWAYVNVGGKNGYISMSNLTYDPPAEPINVTAYAKGLTTKLYTAAKAGSDYVEIPCMTKVTLKKHQAGTGYYWVEYRAKNYYVYLNSKDIDEFFTTDLDELKAGIRSATVTTVTKFRSGPSSVDDSNVIEQLKVGTKVTVIAVSSLNTWSYVRVGNTYGYVISKSLG